MAEDEDERLAQGGPARPIGLKEDGGCGVSSQTFSVATGGKEVGRPRLAVGDLEPDPDGG